MQVPVRLDWPLPLVARITLARADALNTLTLEAVAALDMAIEKAQDGGARIIIVTGEGRAFCAGAHVTYFTDPQSTFHDNPQAIRDAYVAPIVAVFRKLRDGPAASIAAINGLALGGGGELALACDLRLMARTARIGLPEARLGAVPGAGGLQLLAKTIGRAKALEMILLAEQWSAEQALAAGLCTEICDDDALQPAALDLARRLLRCSPAAIALAKQAIAACEVADPETADQIGLDAVRTIAASPDWRDGMTAFRDKRQPDFAQ